MVRLFNLVICSLKPATIACMADLHVKLSTVNLNILNPVMPVGSGSIGLRSTFLNIPTELDPPIQQEPKEHGIPMQWLPTVREVGILF